MKYLTIGSFASDEATCPTGIVWVVLYDFWLVVADRLLDMLAGYPSFELTKTGMGADIVSPSENCGLNFRQHGKAVYRILPVLLGQAQSVVDTVRDRDFDVFPLPILQLLAQHHGDDLGML